MESKGLLFIPDISGFTRFVNETDIDHSRLIIQELLELLINSNEIGLEVSEIEGDAILFYKFGESPDLASIYKQVERMFCQFHQQLIAYDNLRYCHCKACQMAAGLSLKVITHYGEFVGYNVKNFNKLIGKDIIVAHQLLKNDIDQHEYWLVTDTLSGSTPERMTDWMNWNKSSKQTEGGEVNFRYTQLGQLKIDLVPEPLPMLDIGEKKCVLRFTREFDTDIIELFHAAGDFNNRPRWVEGVERIDSINHFLPRVGMSCRYLGEKMDMRIHSSGYSYSPELIKFTETNDARDMLHRYTLERIGEKRSRLTLEYFIRKGFLNELRFKLQLKTKIKASIEKSLTRLESLLR